MLEPGLSKRDAGAAVTVRNSQSGAGGTEHLKWRPRPSTPRAGARRCRPSPARQGAREPRPSGAERAAGPAVARRWPGGGPARLALPSAAARPGGSSGYGRRRSSVPAWTPRRAAVPGQERPVNSSLKPDLRCEVGQGPGGSGFLSRGRAGAVAWRPSRSVSHPVMASCCPALTGADRA